MIAAQETTTLVVYNNADWLEPPWAFLAGSAADDFTGCSIAGGLYLDGTLVFDMSSASGFATIALPNLVSVSVPKASLPAARNDYQLSLVLVTAGGARQGLLNAAVRVTAP